MIVLHLGRRRGGTAAHGGADDVGRLAELAPPDLEAAPQEVHHGGPHVGAGLHGLRRGGACHGVLEVDLQLEADGELEDAERRAAEAERVARRARRVAGGHQAGEAVDAVGEAGHGARAAAPEADRPP